MPVKISRLGLIAVACCLLTTSLSGCFMLLTNTLQEAAQSPQQSTEPHTPEELAPAAERIKNEIPQITEVRFTTHPEESYAALLQAKSNIEKRDFKTSQAVFAAILQILAEEDPLHVSKVQLELADKNGEDIPLYEPDPEQAENELDPTDTEGVYIDEKGNQTHGGVGIFVETPPDNSEELYIAPNGQVYTLDDFRYHDAGRRHKRAGDWFYIDEIPLFLESLQPDSPETGSETGEVQQ